MALLAETLLWQYEEAENWKQYESEESIKNRFYQKLSYIIYEIVHYIRSNFHGVETINCMTINVLMNLTRDAWLHSHMNKSIYSERADKTNHIAQACCECSFSGFQYLSCMYQDTVLITAQFSTVIVPQTVLCLNGINQYAFLFHIFTLVWM